jgi:hypothetical protein
MASHTSASIVHPIFIVVSLLAEIEEFDSTSPHAYKMQKLFLFQLPMVPDILYVPTRYHSQLEVTVQVVWYFFPGIAPNK